MPKILQLYGLAKRMKRTITESVRSMLSNTKLLKSYWVEAMMIVVYLINRSPLVPLDGDVPQRVWIGRYVSYKNLIVFVCLGYMHIVRDQISKLDNKTKPCIFLWYLEHEFGVE